MCNRAEAVELSVRTRQWTDNAGTRARVTGARPTPVLRAKKLLTEGLTVKGVN